MECSHCGRRIEFSVFPLSVCMHCGSLLRFDSSYIGFQVLVYNLGVWYRDTESYVEDSVYETGVFSMNVTSEKAYEVIRETQNNPYWTNYYISFSPILGQSSQGSEYHAGRTRFHRQGVHDKLLSICQQRIQNDDHGNRNV